MNYYSDFKRYEIFVSSTYKDLKKELKELQEDLSIGLISKEDMEKIKKLEQKKENILLLKSG